MSSSGSYFVEFDIVVGEEVRGQQLEPFNELFSFCNQCPEEI
jgi:hypothetical protein